MNKIEALKAALDGEVVQFPEKTTELDYPTLGSYKICIKYIDGDFHCLKYNRVEKGLSSDVSLIGISKLPTDGYELYKEPLVLKEDPYIGKQIINKKDPQKRGCILHPNYTGSSYYIASPNINRMMDLDEILDLYYIQGKDF